MRIFLLIPAVLLLATAAFAQPTVLCDASTGYRECRVGTSGVIELVREVSTGQCFEGATWGTRSPGVVWVDRGCRAVFTIMGVQKAPRQLKRVVCESQNNERQVCPAETSAGVALARRLSKSGCVEGETWGYDADRGAIWVDQGCRAEFILGAPSSDPPAVPQLDKVVVCESEDGRRKECAADTAGGVQLVRQLSESVCGFGKEWGFDEKGIWVNKGCRAEFVVRGAPRAIAQALTCESKNNTRTECKAETRFGVALARILSENECVLGTSWGFDEKGVWVDQGCRAQFVLGGYRLPPTAVPANAQLMKCESEDGGRRQCPVDTSRGVGLVRQISGADCVLNRTWGYDRNGIWVTDGCRAEFAVAK